MKSQLYRHLTITQISNMITWKLVWTPTDGDVTRSGMHIIISNADKALILIQMSDKFLTQINGKKRIMAIAILVVLKNRYGLRNEYLKWVPRKSAHC